MCSKKGRSGPCGWVLARTANSLRFWVFSETKKETASSQELGLRLLEAMLKLGQVFKCRSLNAASLPRLSAVFKIIPQFSSVAQSCPTLCDPMNHSTTGLPVHHQLPESTQTHVHWVGDAIQPSHPLSSPSPALNLSQHQGLFHWVRSLHQVAKVVELQLHISPSNEYSGLISFRMDWLDLLAVQGTLKSLLQHHSLKHQFFATQVTLLSSYLLNFPWAYTCPQFSVNTQFGNVGK